MNTVKIRRYRPDDVDAIYDAIVESRAELSTWMPWCHPQYTRQDTIVWVQTRRVAWDGDEEKSFLIVDYHDRLLGGCGIHHIDYRDEVAELGYWVRTSATRQGVATAAVRQLCRWAFTDGGLHRIEILASVKNLASQRVAEKAGAIREGLVHARLLLHGVRHDCILFAILNPDD